MVKFKLYFAVQGRHTHVRFFAGDGSLGKCGDLVFRNEEWEAFREKLDPSIEILPEGTNVNRP